MLKILIIISLLVVQCFSIVDIKWKTKQKQNIVNNKIGIFFKNDPGYYKKILTGNEERPLFMQHLTAQVAQKTIFDISLSPYNSRRAIYRFKYPYKGFGDKIKMISTFNNGKKKIITKRIVSSLGENKLLQPRKAPFKPIDYWKSDNSVWDVVEIDKSIKTLYGSNKTEDKGIKVKILKNNNLDIHSIPIQISSDLNLTSIAIFSDTIIKNEKLPSLKAIIQIPPNSIIDYKLDIQIFGDCGGCTVIYKPITVIGQNKNGKLYKSVINAYFWCSEDCEI